MAQVKGNPGIARLSQSMIDLIKDHAPGPETWVEFGTIQPDLSLVVNAFPGPIPPTGYLVLEDVTLTPLLTPTASGGSSPHTHDVPQFGPFLPLAPGDRVLVLFCHRGVDVVVLGRIRYPLTVTGPPT